MNEEIISGSEFPYVEHDTPAVPNEGSKWVSKQKKPKKKKKPKTKYVGTVRKSYKPKEK